MRDGLQALRRAVVLASTSTKRRDFAADLLQMARSAIANAIYNCGSGRNASVCLTSRPKCTCTYDVL